jgi:hypothetical protein
VKKPEKKLGEILAELIAKSIRTDYTGTVRTNLVGDSHPSLKIASRLKQQKIPN